ncbi:hypothetical protein PHYSODRAFT_509082, partial [Phytophthora sojae]
SICLASIMTLKVSQALEQHEQHNNPSILAGVEGYLDDEDWEEARVKPRRRSSSVEATLSSCFSSLSTGLHSVRFAVTTRAKNLCARDASRRGSQLRNSMVKISSTQPERSLARSNSMPAPYHRSSEPGLDLFGDAEDDAGNPANICLSKSPSPPQRRSSTPGGRLSRLLSTRSWTQGTK